MTDTSTSKSGLVRVGRLLVKGVPDADEHRYVLASDYEKLERELAELRGKLDAPAPTPTPLERDEWTPRQALDFYAAGRHFDVVNGRTRILDTGAIASDALKQLSPKYAKMKGLNLASNPHARWLRELASRMRADHNWSHANTCEGAAREIDALSAHRDALMLEFCQEPPSRNDTPASKADLIEFFEEFLWATEGEGSKAAGGVDWSCAINVAKRLLTQLHRVGEPPTPTDTPASKQARVDALIAAAARRAANGVHNQDLYEAERAARNAVLLALEARAASAYGCRNCDETFPSLTERNAHQATCGDSASTKGDGR